MIERSAGILLHVTSLNSEYGYGTLGKEAFEFVKLISEMGFKYWEVLPMNIPDSDDCPYNSSSSFFGNPMVIDLMLLYNDGLITKDELDNEKWNISKSELDIRYKEIWDKRICLFNKVSKRVSEENKNKKKEIIEKVDSNKNLKEASLYLSKINNGDLFCFKLMCYYFEKSFFKVKEYANSLGVKIIGDVPIYVNLNSSDVYYNSEAFLVKDQKCDFVSGVPGDGNFQGQKWGHPLYDVLYLKEHGYKFLLDRFAYFLDRYDLIRIDHFRAFASFYSIPASGSPEEGSWKEGLGREFIEKLIERVGKDKLIAEDVGGENDFKTQELLSEFSIPGMDIVQNNSDVRSYKESRIIYTGTHDNNTLVGFLNKISIDKRTRIINNFGFDNDLCINELASKIVREVLKSDSCLAIIPVQDLLLQDESYRMNVPGTVGKNWHYRMSESDMVLLKGKMFEIKKMIEEGRR